MTLGSRLTVPTLLPARFYCRLDPPRPSRVHWYVRYSILASRCLSTCLHPMYTKPMMSAHFPPTPASACSLYETLLFFTMENNSVERTSLGRAVLGYTKSALSAALKTLESLEGSVKVVHVRYTDTVSQPKEECRRICELAGLDFSSEYEDKLNEYLRKRYNCDLSGSFYSPSFSRSLLTPAANSTTQQRRKAWRNEGYCQVFLLRLQELRTHRWGCETDTRHGLYRKTCTFRI